MSDLKNIKTTANRQENSKEKSLELAISQIEKDHGKGSIMKLGAGAALKGVETISTQSLGLDFALGTGGVPRGRVVEIYGPEASGKTTLTLHLAAECQKQGGIVAFIDAEHALDPKYAENVGIDIDELLISQPDTGEQALDITEILVRSGAVDLIVVDSVAALTPKAEIEGDMGDSHMGLQARLMSQALRKLTAVVSKSNTCLVFINQVREKIGGMSFGNREVTTGGRALKFYASVRLDIRRIAAVKDKDDIIGNRTKVKVVKNKLAPPFKAAEFDIIYGKGISRINEVLDLGIGLDHIKKSGAWFSYEDLRLGQGRDKAIITLTKDRELLEKVLALIKEDLKNGKVPKYKAV